MLFEVSSLLIFLAARINAANILMLSALPSYSHQKWASIIGEGLAARHHNVTIFGPYFVADPPTGVQYIHIGNPTDSYETYSTETLKITKKRPVLIEFYRMANLVRQMCSDVIESPGFFELLTYSNDTFDLIIHDFTGGPCVLPFVHKFNKASLVIATPYANPSFLENIIGGHKQYAYDSHFVLAYSSNMTFFQRLSNFYLHVFEHFAREVTFLRELDNIMPTYFGSDLPPTRQLEKRAKLAFIAANPIIDVTGPLLPNVIPIGGVHIKEPKQLPTNLETFMNSSKKGTILFSFGTALRGDSLSIAKQKMFIDIFAELKDYHFLWKFESNSTVEKLPKNIWIQSWLPQRDILTHPKMKAFITHGGINSILEAIWCGVPMIVMPFTMDQHSQMENVKRLQIGKSLDFYSLTHNSTIQTIRDLLEDPKYSTNVKRLSIVVRDQKESPLEIAIWWIEWLLRHPNVNYLESPVQTLGYIVGNSLDVIAFATVVSLVQCAILFMIVFSLFKKIIRRFSTNRANIYNGAAKHEKQN